MNRVRSTLAMLFGLAVVLGVVWLAILGIRSFFQYLSAVPKELGAALLAATATVLVATLTVMVGRYYERKKELDALYRDKKTEMYDEFLKEFFALFFNPEAERDLVPFLRDFTRKLVLWSGPQVIEAFVAWKDHLAKGEPDAQSIFLTEAFLRAVRDDLRHSNTGLRKGFFAKLFLKEGALFLAMAQKNPAVTLAALGEIEAAIRAKQNSAADG